MFRAAKSRFGGHPLKRVLVIFGVAVCLTAVAAQALSQTWPRQAIHFIISFGAGGGADIVGRILADAMQKRLGQSVVVENKPGAGGILGNELVASATPDGLKIVSSKPNISASF